MAQASTTLYGVLHGIGEKLQPLLQQSRFKETGVLTPDEFVAAGDFLVFKCPTWSWEGGDEASRRPYLPPDKQFLVTRKVPCMKRIKAIEYGGEDEELWDGGGDDGDEWVATHIHGGEPVGEIEEEKPVVVEEVIDEDDIPDMDEFDDVDNLVDPVADPAALQHTDNILQTRTYDLSITYDKYYQTPRVWLFGYDEKGRPLTPEAIMEDISQDHARKTVTIEGHPHVPLAHATIHPCKHAAVMKRITDQLSDEGADLRVDQYIMLFLKFVSSVIPTINYDFTGQ